MKINKIIIMILMSIFMAQSALGSLTDNLQEYYNPGTTGGWLDLSGNGNDATLFGGITGTYFDGSDDYIITSSKTALSIGNVFTFNVNFKTSTTSNGILIHFDGGGSDNHIMVLANGKIEVRMFGGTRYTTTGTYNDNADYMVTVTSDGVNSKLYIDGIFISIVNTGSFARGTNVRIGDLFNGAYKYNGYIYTVGVWNSVLNSSQVTELYTSDGNPLLAIVIPTLSFTSIKADTVNLVNNTFYNSSIFFETTILNASTNVNINHSYSLDGSSLVQYSTNSLTGSLNLDLSEGEYEILFYAYNNETNITSSTFNFSVDTTNPTITNSLTTEFDTYVLNTTQILCSGGFPSPICTPTLSSCTDTNLATCTIEIDSQSLALNSISEITTSHNGNISYIITATDLAGNVVVSNGVAFVNPFQYFNFEVEGSPVSNFTFGGENWTTTAQFPTYSDVFGLGNNSVVFSKTGFETQTVNIIFTNTSNYNQTYNVSSAMIVITIKDKDTGAIITGTTINLEFVASTGLVTSTTTGYKNVTNVLFIEELYTLIVTDSVYLPESVFFTFTNTEILNLDVYLTLENTSNAGILSVKVLDNNGDTVEDAIVIAKQWFSETSSFEATSQAQTGINGKAQLNILLNEKVYKISTFANGEFIETSKHTYTFTDLEDELVLTLTPSILTSKKFSLDNIIASATESYNNVTNVSTISFTWQDTNNEGATGCINTYRSIAGHQSLINSDCLTAASTTFIQAYNINTTQDIILKAEMLVDGQYYTINGFIHNSDNNPATILGKLGFDIMMIPIMFILAIVIAFATKNIYIGVILMVLSAGLSLVLAPTILTGGVVAFCFAIGGLMLFGGA